MIFRRFIMCLVLKRRELRFTMSFQRFLSLIIRILTIITWLCWRIGWRQARIWYLYLGMELIMTILDRLRRHRLKRRLRCSWKPQDTLSWMRCAVFRQMWCAGKRDILEQAVLRYCLIWIRWLNSLVKMSIILQMPPMK